MDIYRTQYAQQGDTQANEEHETGFTIKSHCVGTILEADLLYTLANGVCLHMELKMHITHSTVM